MTKRDGRVRRIFLHATPKGRHVWLKRGSEIKAEAGVDLKDFGGEGAYVQSTMVWGPSTKEEMETE